MHPKRLTLIGVAAIAAGYTFLSSAGPTDDLPRLRTAVAADASAAQCTSVPTPELPAIAAQPSQATRAAGAGKGYQRVCHADLAHFDVSTQLKPLPLALAGLDFTPADLADTPMAAFTSLGGMAESAGSTRTRLYRSFRMPDGHMLTLFEHDLSDADAPGASVPHDATERINGMPARLDVLQGDAGKAVSVLSWRDGQRDYRMWIDANVVLNNSREQLLALAATLPRTTPVEADAQQAQQAQQQDGAGVAVSADASASGDVVLTAGHPAAREGTQAPR